MALLRHVHFAAIFSIFLFLFLFQRCGVRFLPSVSIHTKHKSFLVEEKADSKPSKSIFSSIIKVSIKNISGLNQKTFPTKQFITSLFLQKIISQSYHLMQNKICVFKKFVCRFEGEVFQIFVNMLLYQSQYSILTEMQLPYCIRNFRLNLTLLWQWIIETFKSFCENKILERVGTIFTKKTM